MRTSTLLLTAVTAALAISGCGSSAESKCNDATKCGGAMNSNTEPSKEFQGDDKTFPKDTSQSGLEAFLQSGTYKTWVSDAAPREAVRTHLPKVRVFFNPLAADAVAGGTGVSAPSGAMIVKELYDDAGSQVGVAVTLQPALTPKANTAIYYCKGPAANCALSSAESKEAGNYETGKNTCSGCHSGKVFAPHP